MDTTTLNALLTIAGSVLGFLVSHFNLFGLRKTSAASSQQTAQPASQTSASSDPLAGVISKDGLLNALAGKLHAKLSSQAGELLDAVVKDVVAGVSQQSSTPAAGK